MLISHIRVIAVAACFTLSLSVGPLLADHADATSLSFVNAEGAYFVDSSGERVDFQGVNLGNWFLLEAWMLGIGDVADQHTLFQILDRRFGGKKRDALIELHRETWITEQDFQKIRDLGMNCVRLPIHYSLLLDIEQPGFMSAQGFKWLDRVFEMARSAGLYVFLDLHGVPGGQSVEQPSGRVDSNGLWGSKMNQDLTVLIWETVARRYKDEPVIAAYDIINEPYADGHRAPIREELSRLCERIYQAIRAEGDEHMILFPATQMGFFFYRTPAEMGAFNLGFTEHFYPGIFHAEASLDGHSRFIWEDLYPRKEFLEKWSAPYLVGEFNVVLDRSGGDRMMQLYWDQYKKFGWGATMWSYKLIKSTGGVEDDNWYLVTNDASLEIPDLRSASYEAIEAFFDHSDESYVVDAGMIAALHGELEPTFQLTKYTPPLCKAPEPTIRAGWQIKDIGDVTPRGSAQFKGDGSLTLYGGGDDVFGTHDGFSYVFQAIDGGDFVLEAEIIDFSAAKKFAKAGLMARASTDIEAAMALLNVFSDAGVALSYRAASGQQVVETKAKAEGFPIRLKLEGRDGSIHASWRENTGDWKSFEAVQLNPTAVGFATVSNHLNQIAEVVVSEFILTRKKGKNNE